MAVAVLEKAFQILDIIATNSEASGITEISRRLEIPKATAHRILSTLCEVNAAIRTEDGKYQIGPTTLLWADGYHFSSSLLTLAKPFLTKLRDDTSETIHLIVYERGTAQYIDRIDSPQTIVLRWSRLGSTLPLYCTSAGRAIMAALPERELSNYLESAQLVPRTVNTVTDPKRLAEMMEDIRRCGFAQENEENENNIRCIGAAILNRKGLPVGAVSVTVPAYRCSDADAERFGPMVSNTARSIAALLK